MKYEIGSKGSGGDDGASDGGGFRFDLGGANSSDDDMCFAQQTSGIVPRGLSCPQCGSRSIQATEDQTQLKCMVCHFALASDAINATMED